MAAADPEKMKIPVILDIDEFYRQLAEGLINASSSLQVVVDQMRNQAQLLLERRACGDTEIHADGSDLGSVSDAVESEVDSAQDDEKADLPQCEFVQRDGLRCVRHEGHLSGSGSTDHEFDETASKDPEYEIPQIRRSYDELSSGYCYAWDCYAQHDDYDPHKPMSDVTETFDEAHKSLIEHVRVFHG